MDRITIATSMARALMALARSSATGCLYVTGPYARAEIYLEGGMPRAVSLDPSDEERLGDVLAKEGCLDSEAHERALGRGLPTAPIGNWLIANGAATAPAVAYALRLQLRRRIVRIFQWREAVLHFAPGAAPREPLKLSEPLSVSELVLGAMREIVAQEPLWWSRKRVGEGLLVLTPLGEALVEDASLWPEESAVVFLLRQGMPVEGVLEALQEASRAVRALVTFKLLQAVAPPSTSACSYSLLLRKLHQVRRSVTADVLLDLPAGSDPAAARKALRRLAKSLHPDRFGEAAPPGVSRSSGEVMSALLQAERELSRRSAS